MRGKARPLGRVVLTQKQRDQKFLARALNRSGLKCSESEAELVTNLVARYHDAAYEEINHMIYTRSPLELEVLLDNFDFLMGKIKGGTIGRMEHSAQIAGVYDLAPEMHCRWRTAPLAVRRKAFVVVRLSTLLEEAMNLPDSAYAEDGIRPSPYFIDLGMKHWNRLDDLIDLVLDHRMLELAVIDLIMEDNLATPLTDGAL
jgi:hypothetical protein